jgi:hypothetical protein
MILTDKAKEEFSKWYFNKGNKEINVKEYSLDIAKAITNALIIEWFSTLKYKRENFWLHVFEFYYKMRIDGMTISDINIQAIKKGNELFNYFNKHL